MNTDHAQAKDPKPNFTVKGPFAFLILYGVELICLKRVLLSIHPEKHSTILRCVRSTAS